MAQAGKSAAAAGGLLVGVFSMCGRFGDDVARLTAAGGDDLLRGGARVADDVMASGGAAEVSSFADDLARGARGAGGLVDDVSVRVRPPRIPAIGRVAGLGDDARGAWVSDVAQLGVDGVDLAFEVLGDADADDAEAWAAASEGARSPAALAVIVPDAETEFRRLYGRAHAGELLRLRLQSMGQAKLSSRVEIQAWLEAHGDAGRAVIVAAVVRPRREGSPIVPLPDGTQVTGDELEAWASARGLTLLLAGPPQPRAAAASEAFGEALTAVRAR